MAGITELATILGYICATCRVATNDEISILSTAHAVLEERVKQLNDIVMAITALDRPNKPLNVEPAGALGPAEVTPIPPDNNPSRLPTTNGATDEGHGARPVGGLSYSEVVKVVQKTVTDAARRKKNIIISGLVESTTDGENDDAIAFLALCEYHLRMQPRINGTKRLGKAPASGKSRRLLIVLESDAVADEILRRARTLRDADDDAVKNTIFINRDLSPEEERFSFERRQLRRQSAVAGQPSAQLAGGDRPPQSSHRSFFRSRGQVFRRTPDNTEMLSSTDWRPFAQTSERAPQYVGPDASSGISNSTTANIDVITGRPRHESTIVSH